jgi:hypothetical protein
VARRGRGAPLSGTYMAAHAQQPAPPTRQRNTMIYPTAAAAAKQQQSLAVCVSSVCVCLGRWRFLGRNIPSVRCLRSLYIISPPRFGAIIVQFAVCF